MSAAILISRVGMLFLFGSIYLESLPFSFETIIGRIRPNVVLVLLLAYAMILTYFLEGKKIKLPRSAIYLALYIAVNILSLLIAGNLRDSLRHSHYSQYIYSYLFLNGIFAYFYLIVQ